jgi:hypothetical protein
MSRRRSASECVTPTAYGPGRGLERVLINIELVPRESTETAEHLEEDLTVEAGVLCDCQLAQMLQPETRLKRGEVDEVACLCPAEHGQHLVDGKLLDAEQEPQCGPICGKETCVCGDVDARAFIPIGDDEAGEPGGDLHLVHGQPSVADGGHEDRHNLIDLRGVGGEEVEVTGQTVDLAAGNESCASGSTKPDASLSPAKSAATRSCRGLSTQGRIGHAGGTTPPTPSGRKAGARGHPARR